MIKLLFTIAFSFLVVYLIAFAASYYSSINYRLCAQLANYKQTETCFISHMDKITVLEQELPAMKFSTSKKEK